MLTRDVFAACGNAIVANAAKRRHDLRAASVSPTHVHLVIELPDDVDSINEILGWMKRFATRAVREMTDDFDDVDLWAEGSGKKAIDDPAHLREATNYVLNKQGVDAWTWSPERGASW